MHKCKLVYASAGVREPERESRYRSPTFNLSRRCWSAPPRFVATSDFVLNRFIHYYG